MSTTHVAWVALAVASHACASDGDDDGPSDTAPIACPSGTSAWTAEDDGAVFTWCQDDAGFAHGPYVETLRGATPQATGQFDRGRPDGLWHFFDGRGDPALDARYALGVVDGAWVGYHTGSEPTAGKVAYEHTWRGGVACDTWIEYNTDGAITAETDYIPCDDLDAPAPLEPPDLAPHEPPSWDRATCPTGSSLAVASNTYACVSDASGLREGPYAEVFAVDASTAIEGSFVAGERVGTWRHYDPDGALLARGDYRDDLRDGIWWSWRADRTPLEHGAYVAGARSGPWVEHGVFGMPTAQGDYVDGERDGLWKRSWDIGVVRAEEHYQAGVLDGAAKRYYATGVLAEEGGYVAGWQDGVWTTYYPGGEIECETPFVNQRRHGVERCWDLDGLPSIERPWVGGAQAGRYVLWFAHWLTGKRLKSVTTVIDGLIEGPVDRRYEASGAVAATFDYVHGLREGPFVEYWENGQPHIEGTFVAGQAEFEVRWYWEDGTPWIVSGVRHGIFVGDYAEWWPNGNLRRRGMLGDGLVPFGVWECGDEAGTVATRDYGTWNDERSAAVCE